MSLVPENANEKGSQELQLESQKDSLIDDFSAENKVQVEMIISEEELIKRGNKIISLIKLKKFKDLKSFLNRFNEFELRAIIESKYQEINFEIETSFSKTGDVTFFHIYNALSPHVDNIFLKYEKNILQFYNVACSAQQKSRMKLLEDAFGGFINLKERVIEDIELKNTDKDKLREFLQNDNLLRLLKDLQRFIKNIGGIYICKDVVYEEFKRQISINGYKPTRQKIKAIGSLYPELSLFINKSIHNYSSFSDDVILEEYINELLEGSKLLNIGKISALYNEIRDNRLGDKMIEYVENSQLDESTLIEVCKSGKIYNEDNVFFKEISQKGKTELIKGFLLEMNNQLYTENDILGDNPDALCDNELVDIIQHDLYVLGVHLEDIDVEINEGYRHVSSTTICIRNYIGHLPLLRESIKYISLEELDKYFSSDPEFEFDISLLKKYIFNNTKSKEFIFQLLVSNVQGIISDKNITLDNYEEEDKELIDISLAFNGYDDLFTFLKEHKNYFSIDEIIQFHLNMGFAYTSREVLYFISHNKGISEDELLNRFTQLQNTHASYLISSDSHETELAQLDDLDYMFLNHYVYKKGNYSSHEENIEECENQLSHISKYSFNTEGYPVVLNGIKGYELKKGEIENIELLGSYTQRIENIHNMNNEGKLNKDDFYELVEGYFSASNIEEFTRLENLSIEEKIICLLIEEIISIDSGRSNNSEILDLIIIYGYVFVNHLGDYIQHTRDCINKEKDNVSQNRIMWNELSNIYGEDIKHTLRNQIFEQGQKGENFKKILEIYLQKIGIELEQYSIKDKQLSRIQHTLNNDNIPEGKKYAIIEKQILQMFKGGIKLDNESQLSLEKEILDELSIMEGQFDFDMFKGIVPNLFNIKEKYKNKLDKKLENLFTRDINNISNEVNKYQEVFEVEEKTVNMNGDTKGYVKKVSKSRRVNGYFTKTKESSNARMGAFICIAGDEHMWKNENYFELVLQNTETKECEGLVMLLNIETIDGKKYLWFGPNPNQGFLEKVSSEKCYNYLYETVCNFAQENKFDGVVVPSSDNAIVGQCTNRGGDFPEHIKQSRIKDAKGAIKVVEFGGKHELGGGYTYSDGALIWER